MRAWIFVWNHLLWDSSLSITKKDGLTGDEQSMHCLSVCAARQRLQCGARTTYIVHNGTWTIAGIISIFQSRMIRSTMIQLPLESITHHFFWFIHQNYKSNKSNCIEICYMIVYSVRLRTVLADTLYTSTRYSIIKQYSINTKTAFSAIYFQSWWQYIGVYTI